MPQTFIHGEFYASNVLISEHADPTRICPIDWEMAAIGPALLDLAALIAGNWPEEQRTEMAMAYYESLPPACNFYGSVEAFFQALRCCRLFLAVKWLGWSSDWQAPNEHRCDWLAEAAELSAAIESV
jgi:aminoglycoside phosphotransferase (APT) family kinase protein